MRLSALLFAARKYRFVDPKSKKGRNIVWSQVIKFVIGWHLLGYIIYRNLQGKARELDPDFDNKSSAQKQLVMLGRKDLSDVKQYQMTKDGIKMVHDPELSKLES